MKPECDRPGRCGGVPVSTTLNGVVRWPPEPHESDLTTTASWPSCYAPGLQHAGALMLPLVHQLASRLREVNFKLIMTAAGGGKICLSRVSLSMMMWPWHSELQPRQLPHVRHDRHSTGQRKQSPRVSRGALSIYTRELAGAGNHSNLKWCVSGKLVSVPGKFIRASGTSRGQRSAEDAPPTSRLVRHPQLGTHARAL